MSKTSTDKGFALFLKMLADKREQAAEKNIALRERLERFFKWRGLEIIELIRIELISSEVRYSYFSTVQDYYDLYTDLLVSRFEKTKNNDDLALALQISERSRSRSLVELLQEAKVNFKQRIDSKLLDELKTL